MPGPDVAELVSDPDFAEDFTIQRQVGGFGKGGWVASQPQIIPAFGVVSVATPDEVATLPEGDRVNEVRVFHSQQEMKVTSGAQTELSDVLVYDSVKYRVLIVSNYANRGAGFYRALATRLAGN